MEITSLSRGLTHCDEAAWAHFHERYYPWLLRRAIGRGAAACDAPEIVQRIYLRIIRHAKVFHEASAFEAWLACLTRCEVIDAARRGKRRGWLGERFQQWQESRGEKEQSPRSELLQQAMDSLADSDRKLVSRHYIEGWSQAELAVEAGTSVKAIERQLARLRLRLREQLSSPENC